MNGRAQDWGHGESCSYPYGRSTVEDEVHSTAAGAAADGAPNLWVSVSGGLSNCKRRECQLVNFLLVRLHIFRYEAFRLWRPRRDDILVAMDVPARKEENTRFNDMARDPKLPIHVRHETIRRPVLKFHRCAIFTDRRSDVEDVENGCEVYEGHCHAEVATWADSSKKAL